MSKIRITVKKFDNDLFYLKKPIILTWDLVIVGLNPKSLEEYY